MEWGAWWGSLARGGKMEDLGGENIYMYVEKRA